MENTVSKNLVMTVIRKHKHENMYNSFIYQAMVKLEEDMEKELQEGSREENNNDNNN